MSDQLAALGFLALATGLWLFAINALRAWDRIDQLTALRQAEADREEAR